MINNDKIFFYYRRKNAYKIYDLDLIRKALLIQQNTSQHRNKVRKHYKEVIRKIDDILSLSCSSN